MSRAALASISCLHRTALDVAQHLATRHDVRAVALTGSLARGDADAGSDVDLWVIGARDGRDRVVVDGIPVTLLQQTLRQFQHPETLLLYEIADAQILHDPDGLLAELQARYRRERPAIRAHMVQGTLAVIGDLIHRSQASSPAYALSLLREAARRAACLRVYESRGWRVPRWRQYEHELPARALRSLERVLGFPPAPAQLVAVEATLQTLWTVPGFDRSPQGGGAWPPPLPSPGDVDRLRKAGRDRDLLLLLRQHLIDEPARARPRPCHLKLWREVHGIPAGAERQRRDHTLESLPSLLRALRLGS